MIKKDLTGIKYFKLTFLKYSHKNKLNQLVWEVLCDCGNIVKLPSQRITSGNTKSCGCLRKIKQLEWINSFIGKKFGRLEILKLIEIKKRAVIIVECKCDCGTLIRRDLHEIKRGKCLSCGCLQKELLAKRTFKHGQSCTANKNQSKEYGTWRSMIDRCYNNKNPSFHRYGGKGITVYESWKNSFIEFFAYMGKAPTKEHSIDRINPLGNYEPNNVRWADKELQARNQLKRPNKTSIYRGVSYSPKTTRKWQSGIRINKKPKFLGYFETEVEAARAYNSKALEIWGNGTWINKID